MNKLSDKYTAAGTIEINGFKEELPEEVRIALEDFFIACTMNGLNLVAIEFAQGE